METFPAHVVCARIGNSEAIAKKHYLQVTDDHFARAVKAEQTAQQAHAESRIASQTRRGRMKKPRFFRGYMHSRTLPPRGFEPRLPP